MIFLDNNPIYYWPHPIFKVVKGTFDIFWSSHWRLLPAELSAALWLIGLSSTSHTSANTQFDYCPAYTMPGCCPSARSPCCSHLIASLQSSVLCNVGEGMV
jgi:hypothetical protein